MMRLSFAIVSIVTLVLLGCRDENPHPLVKSYSVVWEADLAVRYVQPVGSVSYFEHLSINPDGSVMVLHSNSSNETVLTKLTREGAFNADAKLVGEYVTRVSRSEENELVTLSSSGANYHIKIWSNALAVAHTEVVQPSAPLSQIVIQGSSYYIIDSENGST